MPAAVSSIFKTSIALAGAGVIALSPVLPTQDVRVPTVNLPAIELAAATPAIGAIPYQIGVNTVGNILALAPIVIGSTDQCSICLGPLPGPGLPFTGYGAIGFAANLLKSPIVFFQVLQAEGLGQALGAAALALQVPIVNTLNLLGGPRTPSGGFQIDLTLARAYSALRDTINGVLDVAFQALVTGPLGVIKGGVAGGLAFAETLASSGDLISAINAGRALFEPAVDAALSDLTAKIDIARTQVYTDLIGPPTVATSPIPPATAAVPGSARPAAAELTGGPVTKVTDSVKAVPGATAGSSDNAGSGGSATAAGDEGSAAGGSKASTGTGSTKRQHKAD